MKQLHWQTTITDTIRRAVMARLSWPLPAALNDASPQKASLTHQQPFPNFFRPQPEWSDLHKELTAGRDMTLMLLWQKYKEHDPK